MKKIAKQNKNKKIIIVLIIVMLCNFFASIPIFADNDDDAGVKDGDNGSKLKGALSDFVLAIGDIVVTLLQKNFVGINTIKTADNKYSIKYSPAIILSGTLPAFDINFISPVKNADRYVILENEKTIECKMTTRIAYREDDDIVVDYKTHTDEAVISNIISTLKNDNLEPNNKTVFVNSGGRKEYNPEEDLATRTDTIIYMEKLQDSYNFYAEDTIKAKEENKDREFTDKYQLFAWWWDEDPSTGKINEYKIYGFNGSNVCEGNDTDIKNDFSVQGYAVKITKTVLEKQAIAESVAKIMRKTISTWYIAMREIALVGLLVILVYVAIKMILTASSADKAKCKKILFDWFVAVVIIFTLHYMISVILSICNAISKAFAANVISEDGSDKIFSSLRSEVSQGNIVDNLFKMIMYYYLIILTIKFTIRYFKRVVYMAFLTMIGPIIGLTYPLDKLKDGQAQALGLWIKEFTFNAIIQPFELIVYYLFTSIAISDPNVNSFYSLVVLGFMTPAENLLRKMFGFDKGGQLGSMEAAFGGATVMNAINKIGTKGAKGKKGSPGKEEGNKTKIRTANNNMEDPYAALRETKNKDGEGTTKTKTQQKKLEHQRKMEIKKKEERRNKGNKQSDTQSKATNNTEPNRQKSAHNKKNNSKTKGKSKKYSGSKAARQSAAAYKGKPKVPHKPSPKPPETTKPIRTANQGGANDPRQASQGRSNDPRQASQGRSNDPRQASQGGTNTPRQASQGGTSNPRQASQGGTSTPRQASQGGTSTPRQASQGGTSTPRQANQGGTSVPIQTNQSGARAYSQDGNQDNGEKRTIRRPSIIRRTIDNPTIRGCASVGGMVLKGVGRGALRAAGIATFGTIGLAAGIATGDMEKAVLGLTGGIAAGNKVGNNVATGVSNMARGARGVVDTFREGKYGQAEAERIKRVREFRNSREYRDLLNKFPNAQKSVETFTNAGITDASKIRIALQNSNNYSTDNAIAYMNMARLCPDEIFEDRDKFNVYLESHGIPKGKAQEIYKAVREFK